MRARRWLRDPRLLLAAVLGATVIAYLPTLQSPLYLDDYIYVAASRDLDTSHYLRLIFTPWSRDPAMPFTRDFWRPLSFLYFLLTEPVFGGRPLPYHLVNTAIHLTAAALVWVLARKLDPRSMVAGAAVVVFALYPGSTEAVSWISSVNSAALPIMLGSWLLFLSATREPEARWRHLAAAAVLFAIALMFRETAVTVLAPLALWYVLVQRRGQWREPRTYAVLVPYLLVCALYYLIRTKLFTEPAANPEVYKLGDQLPGHWWYFIKNAFLPFRTPVLGWREHAQEVAGVLLLATMALAFITRRWRYAALLLAICIAVAPSAAATLGVGQRYLYTTTPVIGLVIGLALADARERLQARGFQGMSATLVAPPLLAVALAAGVFIVRDRNDNWGDGPRRQQAWVEELRAEYPHLPAGGILFCVSIPFELSLFDAANLGPVVRWYYPDTAAAFWARDPAAIPPLGPNDRIFVAGDGIPGQ